MIPPSSVDLPKMQDQNGEVMRIKTARIQKSLTAGVKPEVDCIQQPRCVRGRDGINGRAATATPNNQWYGVCASIRSKGPIVDVF
jgi:hypothetical protein